MSQINKLTYDEKINKIPVVDRPTQATAEDFNDIKTVVNNCVDGINQIKSDEVQITAGTTTVIFLAAYPVGLSYGIVIHNFYDTKGYLVAHTITNKSETGFDLTVSKAGTFVYLTVPRR